MEAPVAAAGDAARVQVKVEPERGLNLPQAPPAASRGTVPSTEPRPAPVSPHPGEPLQCSRCLKWLNPGAKYRNKRLRLCSSCYVNHHNHASQDAKKKYDRSRKRSMSEKRTHDGVGRRSTSRDLDDEDSPTESSTPTPRLFPAPFPPAQPPQFSIPIPVTAQPRGFRPPMSPSHTMLGGGEVNQLGNPRSPSVLPCFSVSDIPIRGRIGSAPGTPTTIPLMEINQLSQGRIGSPGQPGTPTMSSLFPFPAVNPLTDIDLQVSSMAGRVMSFEQQTEGVITAVATLIAQEPEPADDNNRLQYLETDIRKLYALETEWKRWAGQYSNTIMSAKKLLEQLQSSQGNDSPIFSYCASRLGALEYRAGNFNNAAKLFITAIIHNERVHRKMEVLADTQKVGIAYGGAGFVDEERSFHELAIRLGKALLPAGLQPRESPPSHAMLLERSAVFHHNCSIYYFRIKAYDLAEECNQEAMRLFRILPQIPQRNTQRAAALHERALLLAQRNEYSAAQSNMEESLKLSREAYGENHPRLAESLTSMGILLYLMDKVELAQSYLYKALKMKMQLHSGESHPSILATLQALGLISLRDPTQAVFNPMRIFEHRPILADIADQERDE